MDDEAGMEEAKKKIKSPPKMTTIENVNNAEKTTTPEAAEQKMDVDNTAQAAPTTAPAPAPSPFNIAEFRRGMGLPAEPARRPPPLRRCWRCGTPGHLARGCPKKGPYARKQNHYEQQQQQQQPNNNPTEKRDEEKEKDTAQHIHIHIHRK